MFLKLSLCFIFIRLKWFHGICLVERKHWDYILRSYFDRVRYFHLLEFLLWLFWCGTFLRDWSCGFPSTPMMWAVIHRGSDGNKQSNSLPCALEEALPLHWLFKCPHFVCVCTYTFYMLLCLCLDSAHSQQPAATSNSLGCVSHTCQVIWDPAPASVLSWWQVPKTAGYKEMPFFLSWNINTCLCGDPNTSQHTGNGGERERSTWAAEREFLPKCLRDILNISPFWYILLLRCWLQIL